MNTKPILKAFLICDQILDDNGKKSCMGIFDHISSPVFPVTHPRMYVFIVLFAGRGATQFNISFVDPDDNEIFNHTQAVELRGDVATELAFEFNGLPLAKPGSHWFHVKLDEEDFCEFPLAISGMPAKPEFTPDELEKLLADPDAIKHVRAEIECPAQACDAKYVFQMNLDPREASPEDARLFPPDDEFPCEKCGTAFNLAATRLQMRYILGTPAPKPVASSQ